MPPSACEDLNEILALQPGDFFYVICILLRYQVRKSKFAEAPFLGVQPSGVFLFISFQREPIADDGIFEVLFF